MYFYNKDSQNEQQNKHIFWLPNYLRHSRHICEKENWILQNIVSQSYLCMVLLCFYYVLYFFIVYRWFLAFFLLTWQMSINIYIDVFRSHRCCVFYAHMFFLNETNLRIWKKMNRWEVRFWWEEWKRKIWSWWNIFKKPRSVLGDVKQWGY